MAFERMLDKDHPPSKEEMATYMGQTIAECWSTLTYFIETTYAVEPEFKFAGKKYGWEFAYRKGGRPICDLFPENGAFTALIVLGSKEGAEAFACLDSFGVNVRTCLENTPAFHDGRWLWIRVQTQRDVEDFQRLVTIKRKPARSKQKSL